MGITATFYSLTRITLNSLGSVVDVSTEISGIEAIKGYIKCAPVFTDGKYTQKKQNEIIIVTIHNLKIY